YVAVLLAVALLGRLLPLQWMRRRLRTLVTKSPRPVPRAFFIGRRRFSPMPEVFAAIRQTTG
ncbi:hypothetical protein FA090_15130, partial [Pseudomonas aeruginosa]|nr:hypothetical protein [Pseudomonas aeruginosa]